MITAFMFFGLSGGGRADDENWSFVRNEASLSVTLGAPSGTSSVPNGAQRQVNVTVQRFTWEVWESDLGNSETRNYGGGPRSNASVSFSLAGGGSLSASTAQTDGSGGASTTLTMGAEAVELQALVTDTEGTTTTTASADLAFTPAPPVPDPESWSYLRSESLLSASVSVPDGAADVPVGATRQAQVHVSYTSWEVWESNYNNFETRSYSSSPASYAAVSWSVQDGNGSVPAGSAGQADANGDASVAFTMGDGLSTLLADVSYAGSVSGATGATVTFVPVAQEQWTYLRTEGYISTSLTPDGGLSTTDLPSGSVRNLTAQVRYSSQEIWVSDQGRQESRNQMAGAAIEAEITFSRSWGDGSISSSNLLTDINGRAFATFTMGNEDCRVTASANYAGAYSAGALDFTAEDIEIWTQTGTSGSLSVMLSTGGTGPTISVTANVAYTSWEIWTSDQGGTENRNEMTGPAILAPVMFSAGAGASVSPSDTTTDTAGYAGTTVVLGNQASSIQATASFNGTSSSATIGVPAYVPPPVITAGSLPSGTVGLVYNAAFGATGGAQPYQWSVLSGYFPTGLSLNSDGTITGTPIVAGSFSFTVEVAGLNTATATADFAISIASAPTPTAMEVYLYGIASGQIQDPAAPSGGDLGSGPPTSPTDPPNLPSDCTATPTFPNFHVTEDLGAWYATFVNEISSGGIEYNGHSYGIRVRVHWRMNYHKYRGFWQLNWHVRNNTTGEEWDELYIPGGPDVVFDMFLGPERESIEVDFVW